MGGTNHVGPARCWDPYEIVPKEGDYDRLQREASLPNEDGSSGMERNREQSLSIPAYY